MNIHSLFAFLTLRNCKYRCTCIYDETSNDVDIDEIPQKSLLTHIAFNDNSKKTMSNICYDN
jgi:hypothetical protein